MSIRRLSCVIALAVSCLPVRPVQAAGAQCSAAMHPGTVCGCALAALHPTQMAVGRLHVEELKKKGFDDLSDHVARKKHAKIVFGPDGTTYIVDGHHHAAAMISLEAQGSTTCEIAGPSDGLPSDPEAFWREMERRNHARLEGVDGVEQANVYPPAKFAELGDDPFRSLSSWVESRCGVKLEGDYADFKLADLLRRDPKAATPRVAADEGAATTEALAYLHGPAAGELAGISNPSDAASLRSCQ